MLTKNWQYLVGQKIGYLTVLEILPPGTVTTRPGKSSSAAKCICECGSIVYRDCSNVARKMGVTCGSKECRHKYMCAAQALRYQLFPKGKKKSKPINKVSTEAFPRSKKTVLEEKLDLKYKCTHPSAACIRSDTLNICCWECDKPCKQCSNTPEMCGARLRQKPKKKRKCQKN